MQSHTVEQLVKINVYNTETDMPHGFALLWQNFIKYLPTIGLVIIGLVALALVIYIIVKYHRGKNFWRHFGIASVFLLLFSWGYYNFNKYTTPLTLGSNEITIDIIKDTGTVTASANSSLSLAMSWQYGHDTYASVNQSDKSGPFGESVSAADSGNQIKLFLNNTELTNEKSYVSTSTAQEEDYTVSVVVDPNLKVGNYSVVMALEPTERDSMMSSENSLSRSNLGEPSKIPEDLQFITDATCDPNNKECLKTQKNSEDTGSQKYSLHQWLNAPDPIRRENIKSITFEQGTFNYSAYSDDSTVRQAIQDCQNNAENKQALQANDKYCVETVVAKQNGATNYWGGSIDPKIDTRTKYDGCWDISEHQSGTVIACYIERVRTTEWDGGGGGLFSWFTSLFNNNIRAQCENDTPAVDEDDSSAVAARNKAVDDCVATKKIPVFLGVYDIVIRQEGGVDAPKNSYGLFYYTGQNPDYCMYGPKTVVDPGIQDAERLIFNVEDGSGKIVDVPQILNNWKDWWQQVQWLAQTDKRTYVEQGFWSKLLLGDKNVEHVKELLSYCHEDYIDTPTTISLVNFRTDGVENMSHIFEGAMFNDISGSLATIKDASWFKTKNVTDMSYMFADIAHHNAGDFDNSKTGLDFSSVTSIAGMFRDSRFKSITLSSNDNIISDMSYLFSGLAGGITNDTSNGGKQEAPKWKDTGGRIDITGFSTKNATDMKFMFADTNAQTIASPSTFITTNVTDMSFMFDEASNVGLALNIGHFDTANVKNMTGMFAASKFGSIDLSGFNTSKVTSMARMFEGCDTASLNLSTFDTSNVTDMHNMFYYTTAGTVDFGSKFITNNVTDMSYMFADTIMKSTNDAKLNFNTSNVTNMSYMFFNSQNAAGFVKLGSFDTSKVTDMSYMFGNFHIETEYEHTYVTLRQIQGDSACDSDRCLEKAESQPATDVQDGREKDKLYVTDSDYNDTQETTAYMDNSQTILGSALDGTKDPKILGALWLQKLKELFGYSERELSNWRGVDPQKYGRHYDTTNSLDLTSFNTSNVENMEGMFAGAQNPTINLSTNKFNTTKVKNMAYMFAMINATEINTQIANFDTSNVENMDGMFAGLYLDANLNLSSFKSDHLQSAKFMFAYNDITGGVTGTFTPCRSGDFNDPNCYTFIHATEGGSVKVVAP